MAKDEKNATEKQREALADAAESPDAKRAAEKHLEAIGKKAEPKKAAPAKPTAKSD